MTHRIPGRFRLKTICCLALMLSATGCINPYACRSESRFAEYKGRLGLQEPLQGELTVRDPGRIFLSLDQFTGSDSQELVTLSLNVWSFAGAVAEVHVHEKSGINAGRILFSASSGLLVGDSVWNADPQLYNGPVSWNDLWETLENGNAYLELHPADGKPPVTGLLTLARSRGFQPSCT